jgi:hypothetical protein
MRTSAMDEAWGLDGWMVSRDAKLASAEVEPLAVLGLAFIR